MRIFVVDHDGARWARHRYRVRDSPLDLQSNSESRRRSSRTRGHPDGPAPEICARRSADRVSGDSRTLCGEHRATGRTPARHARTLRLPDSHAKIALEKNEPPACSRSAPPPEVADFLVGTRPACSLLRTRTADVPVPAHPVVDVHSKPSDGPAVKALLPRETADERECRQNPVVAPRQTRHIARSQNLIPCGKSFVDPAGYRHVQRCNRDVVGCSQPRDVGAHGDCCS